LSITSYPDFEWPPRIPIFPNNNNNNNNTNNNNNNNNNTNSATIHPAVLNNNNNMNNNNNNNIHMNPHHYGNQNMQTAVGQNEMPENSGNVPTRPGENGSHNPFASGRNSWAR
jgi:hypothetical protein